jgi:LysM repeat protein
MRIGRSRRNKVIASCLCAAIVAGCGLAAPAAPFTPEVNILWTPDATPTLAVRLTGNPATPNPAITTPIPTSTPQSYTIVDGDTLWDIAVRYGLTIDEMVAANPGINPDKLKLDQVITIPVPGAIDTAQIAQVKANVTATALAGPQGSPGMVAADANGLRMREGPSATSDVVAKLDALTALTVIKHSNDGQWLLVALGNGNRGWVMVQYVDMATNTAGPGVATEVVKAGGGVAISTETLKGGLAISYLSGFNTRARDIFAAGQALGNRANVFAVIGDSNSASPLYLEPFDTGNYTLGTFGYLADTIRFFKGSFRFTTVAAVVGFDTMRMMDPTKADPTRCLPSETPLACEYRRKRPAVALILLGTNDTGNWQNFEANFRRIVEYTIAKGIVPILTTKGDDLENTKYNGPSGAINSAIIKLSREYGVPLLDLHSVVTRLPSGGFGTDGFHYNVPPDAQTANFSGTHMNYGYTIRNLTSLQALDAVRRLVIGN